MFLLAALAATSAIVAGSAFAGNGTTSCADGTRYDGATIPANLDVPAGATCTIVGGEVKGTVTVEGQLNVYGYWNGPAAKFDKTITVDGGAINVGNGGIDVAGTLTIKNSAAQSIINTETGASHIGGNLVFTNNSGHLFVGYGPTNVDGTFSWYGNTSPLPSATDWTQSSYIGSVHAAHTSIS